MLKSFQNYARFFYYKLIAEYGFEDRYKEELCRRLKNPNLSEKAKVSTYHNPIG